MEAALFLLDGRERFASGGQQIAFWSKSAFLVPVTYVMRQLRMLVLRSRWLRYSTCMFIPIKYRFLFSLCFLFLSRISQILLQLQQRIRLLTLHQKVKFILCTLLAHGYHPLDQKLNTFALSLVIFHFEIHIFYLFQLFAIYVSSIDIFQSWKEKVLVENELLDILKRCGMVGQDHNAFQQTADLGIKTGLGAEELQFLNVFWRKILQ